MVKLERLRYLLLDEGTSSALDKLLRRLRQ